MDSYDVIIIGASLAGLSSAIAAAEDGLSVLCIDKKLNIGDNISCAEGIGDYLLEKLPFEIPNKILSWKVDGIKFFCEGIEIERTGEYWQGHTINRKLLEVWLAKKAQKKGVKIAMLTELIGIKLDEDGAVIKIIKNDVQVEIGAKKIIGADGAQSKTARLLKLGQQEHLGNVTSWEYCDVNLSTPNLEQIFYGRYAPSGYAYIFPKSKNSANVGVGTTFRDLDSKLLYKSFLKIPVVKEQLEGAEIIREKSGVAVITKDIPLEYKNVLFAGDAANLNIKPFVEGIIPSIVSGYLAGSALKKYNSGSYTKKVRKEFFQEYNESNNFLKLFLQAKKINSRASDLLTMALISQVISPIEFNTLKSASFSKIRNILLLRVKND